MTLTSLEGVIPVLATPFDERGGLDQGSLRRLIEFQQECRVVAVAVFGMASEGFALGSDDRSAVLETLRLVAPELDVIAGVANSGTAGAIDQLRCAAEGGARTAMVMPPHMVKPTGPQMVDFFSSVADEAQSLGIEVMIQDASGAAGVDMPVEVIKTICEHQSVTSVKIESPPTLVKFEALDGLSAETVMLGGMNAQFVLDEFELGSVGTMPACEFTDLLVPLVDAWTNGQREEARRLYAVLLPLLVWGLQPGIAHAVHKEILVHRGIIDCAAVRLPARPISPSMQQASRDLYDSVVSQIGPS